MNFSYPRAFDGKAWSLRRQGQEDPLSFLQEIAASGSDVVPFSLAGRRAFLVTSPEGIESVFVTQHHKFAKSEGLQRAKRLLGEGLLTSDGARQRQRRRDIQPGFSRSTLESYSAIMATEAAAACAEWKAGDAVDLHSEVARLTLRIMGHIMFGVDLEACAMGVRGAVEQAVTATDPLVSLVAPSRRVREARRRLIAIVDTLVLDVRQSGRDCLLTRLDDCAGATDSISEQLRDDAITLLLAGHDTISNALAWTWLLLARAPEIDARMHDEIVRVLQDMPPTASSVSQMPFVRAVFAESLRLWPPAWILARRALEDVRIGDTTIPAGSLVLVSQYVLHRNPKWFPDPLRFDPERWLHGKAEARPRRSFVPFGAGPRSCIGEGFAWMEGVLVLATIAKDWRIRDSSDGPLRPNVRITMRPQTSRVTLERRDPVVSPVSAPASREIHSLCDHNQTTALSQR
jgi:cytochrome P450